MSATCLSPSTRRLLDFLSELGPRWGLPAIPCRVHGYLYLEARPLGEDELCASLELDAATLNEALGWLLDYQLVERTPAAAWRTDSDPWTLMLQGLEERRRRELGPALQLLRDCKGDAIAEQGSAGVAAVQIDKLLALVEDLAAIDMQASRLSPGRLRQVIRLGGRAARWLDKGFGERGLR